MNNLTALKTEFFKLNKTFADVFGKNAAAKLDQEWFYLQAHFDSDEGRILLNTATPHSICQAVTQAVTMGLTFNTQMDQVCLIRYKDKSTQTSKATLRIQYQGEIYYLRKQKVIIKADLGVVKKNDTFTYERTSKGFDYIHKKPIGQERGPIIGAYCSYLLPNGITHGDYYEKAAIDKREAVAKSGKFWGRWREEQTMKTACRMARKGLPRGEDIALLDSIDNQHFELEDPAVTEDRIVSIQSMVSSDEIGTISQLLHLYNGLPRYEQNAPEVKELFTSRRKELNLKQNAQ